MLQVLSEHPSQSVPQATRNRHLSQSIYRFWSNEQVKREQIYATHRAAVVERGQRAGVVLAIQDTTDLDFTGHPKTQGLGYLNQTRQQGIKVHSCFAVSGEGEPLGLLHQHGWVRDKPGTQPKPRARPIEQKESYRWLVGVTAAEVGFSPRTQLIHVADREADIFELFVHPRQANSDLLIRVEHNRQVQQELGYLLPTLEHAPVLGGLSLSVQRNPQRTERVAQLQLQGMAVTVCVPGTPGLSEQLAPVNLNGVLVTEVNPPANETPIRWMLLTTLPIETFEQVWQWVQWYALRWRIERFHYTLKSGCKIEQLQLETADRLLKALATYGIVAWRLMWLTYHARLCPDAPCAAVFQPQEWKLLRRKFEPKNRSSKPPTLRQAVRWVAQLGGFLARTGDGEPGLKTLWRGLGVLHHLVQGAQLATQH